MTRARRAAVVATALVVVTLGTSVRAVPQPHAARWWKGNTHTHSLWSDGDDFPEMVADWYARHGYDFVALSEHNTLADDERWWPVPPTDVGREALARYRARFGAAVDTRRAGDTTFVRLRRAAEYRAALGGRRGFLLVPAEEITQYLGGRGAHMTALNPSALIPAQRGSTLVEMFRRDLAVADSAAARSGRPVAVVLNHPNFLWSQTAEDIAELPSLRFLEVYNGHPLVHVAGDSLHASAERLWDIVLTHRAARNEPLLYGLATDDAHDYFTVGPTERNAGRGWIVVRAESLSADALVRAMQRGDFYGSTGVTLTDVRRERQRLTISIRAEPGMTYATQFIGTRRGYDTTSTPVRDSAGTPLTRRYSRDVGAVLADVRGAAPSYTFRGDELYVRAVVRSSTSQPAPGEPRAVASAWVQPVRP